ncbi:MAG: type II toxin-antitoxin system HicA family toxin [Chloroflexi bacterium]|nr:type II toxin-antitoxin system HicA family toxin [Chloroflexota bacterium]
MRKLLAAGFFPTGQSGSHVKFQGTRDSRERSVIVPRHREIPVGTLGSILRQAGLSTEEFDSL